MYKHFKEIKEAVEIPIYAYNNLWTGKIISPRLFKRLVDLGYQGMKDAGENKLDLREKIELEVRQLLLIQLKLLAVREWDVLWGIRNLKQ